MCTLIYNWTTVPPRPKVSIEHQQEVIPLRVECNHWRAAPMNGSAPVPTAYSVNGLLLSTSTFIKAEARGVQPAFHDTDIDTDTGSPDTPIHPYVRHVLFPRDDIGVVECGL